MTPRSAVISMQPSYLGYDGLEVAVWNHTALVRPLFAHRKGSTARRDEIVMG